MALRRTRCGVCFLVLGLQLARVGGQALPKCSDAVDCLDCFNAQECTIDPNDDDGKNTVCVPCGWCTTVERSWNAEVSGSCTPAPSGKHNFCLDPTASGFCPSSVCDVDNTKCVCTENSCPVVNLLLHLISLEGFWLLAALILLSLVGIWSCVLIVCKRPPPREVVLVRDSEGAPTASLLGAHRHGASSSVHGGASAPESYEHL